MPTWSVSTLMCVCCLSVRFGHSVSGLVLFVTFSAAIMPWNLLNISQLGHGIEARTHGRSTQSPTWRFWLCPSLGLRPRDRCTQHLPRWRLCGSPTGMGSCYNVVKCRSYHYVLQGKHCNLSKHVVHTVYYLILSTSYMLRHWWIANISRLKSGI